MGVRIFFSKPYTHSRHVSIEVDMKKKIKVRDTLTSFSPYDIDTDLEDVILYFSEMKLAYPNHSNIRLDFDDEEYYGSRHYKFTLCGDREETDKEYEKRLKRENNKKEQRKIQKEKFEKAERKQYESLKKKYDK